MPSLSNASYGWLFLSIGCCGECGGEVVDEEGCGSASGASARKTVRRRRRLSLSPAPTTHATHDFAVLARGARRVDEHLYGQARGPLLLEVEQLGDHELGDGRHQLFVLCGVCVEPRA